MPCSPDLACNCKPSAVPCGARVASPRRREHEGGCKGRGKTSARTPDIFVSLRVAATNRVAHSDALSANPARNKLHLKPWATLMANSKPGDADAFSVPCACATLRRANRAVTQLYDLVLAPVGIKATQFMILKSIYEAGEIAQCVYAREHGIAIETLSRRLSSLRRKGFVEMRRGDHHGERLYRITDSGLALLLRAMPYFERAQYRLRTQLGEDDWQALLQICERAAQAAKDAEQFRARNDLQFSSANFACKLGAGAQ